MARRLISSARSGRAVTVGALLAGAALVGACDDGAVRLPRTEAELAEATRRGDSLAAQIAVGQALADSLDRIARGELDPSLILSLGGVAAGVVSDSGPPAGAPSGDGAASANAASAARAAIAESVALAGARRADSLARAVTAARLRAGALATGAGAGDVGPGGLRRAADTLRGVVTVDGVPPAVRVYLALAGDSGRVALTGLAMRDLLNLDGLEVSVRGVPNGPRELAVSRFVARTYNGTPVDDGMLIRTETGWAIRLTEGGTRPLGTVSPTLQRFGGSRVWIARGSTSSFGVITKR